MKFPLHTSSFLVGSLLAGSFVGGFTSNTDGHLATVTTNQAPQWALREVKNKDGSWSVGRTRPGPDKWVRWFGTDNRKEGVWQEFYANGWQKSEGEYKNGKWEGPWPAWHDNGLKSKEGKMKNGKPEGRTFTWYNNGQKQSDGECKNGKPEGPITVWYKNGSINTKESGIYKAGKRVAPLPKK